MPEETDNQRAAQLEAIENTQVANILRKLQAGKIITHSEMAQVEAWREKNTETQQSNRSATAIQLTVKEEAFAQLYAKLTPPPECYIKAYHKATNYNRKSAKEAASRILARAHIQLRIDELRRQSLAPELLSLDERLTILARDARSQGKGPQWINARARALETYSRLAGDLQAERPVVGTAESPMHVTVPSIVGRIGAREKARLLREGRAIHRITPGTATQFQAAS
jgi:hypothetical protein